MEMKEMQKIVLGLLAIFAMINVCIGINIIGYDADPRISYTIKFLPADPSLKTTDPFYGGIEKPNVMENYVLPPVFGGPMPESYTRGVEAGLINTSNESLKAAFIMNYIIQRPGLKLVKTENKSLVEYKNVGFGDLTEREFERANITLGSENWL
jgi:hypothetical protein